MLTAITLYYIDQVHSIECPLEKYAVPLIEFPHSINFEFTQAYKLGEKKIMSCCCTSHDSS